VLSTIVLDAAVLTFYVRTSVQTVDCAAPDSLPAQLLNGDVVSLARADYSRSVSLTEPGLAACLALPVTFAVGGGKEYRSLSHTTTCFDELFTVRATPWPSCSGTAPQCHAPSRSARFNTSA
jgi:hypothetical protein